MATRSMYEEQRLRERGLLPRASLGGTRLQRIPDADEDPSNDKFRAYVIDAERGEGREAEVSRGEASGLQALDPESMVLGDDEALVGPEQEALLAQAASAKAKPQLSARAVALKELAEGRGGVGPSLVADMGAERATLAGHRGPRPGSSAEGDAAYLAAGRTDRARILDRLDGATDLTKPGGFRGPSPELLVDAERGVSDFQQGLRLKGGEVPVPRGSGNRLPSIQVAKPGDMPAIRAPAALRAPSGRPEPVPDAEGVASRTVPRDEEFAAAQDDSRMRALSAALSRAGARASEAISGVRGDSGVYDALDAQADSPVRELLARREADKRKALEDPTSEQSQRLQAYISKALPGVYTPEELANITAADADAVTRYGEMSQRLQQRAADKAAAAEQRAADIAREDAQRLDDRRWQAQQAGASRAFQAQENAKNRAAELAEAQTRAGSVNGLARGTTVPGLEVAPGAAPTKEDATAVKKSEAARARLNALASELKSLHAEHGTELFGSAARRMEQLTTAMELEAKTIGELGALTGPDLDLVRSLTQVNPTSIGSNLKALVGLDGTQEALGGVQKWADGMANATRETYGYRPPAQQADMVKMLDPQGRERMVPRAKVQAAIAAGGRVVNG